jgi:hypothetical protein
MKLLCKTWATCSRMGLAFFIFVSTCANLIGQSKGSLLIVVNSDCKVYVDGNEQEKVKAEDALKVTVPIGEHYIQAKGKWNGEETTINKTVTVESDKQVMVNLNFGEKQTVASNTNEPDIVTVANVGVKIPGTAVVGAYNVAFRTFKIFDIYKTRY